MIQKTVVRDSDFVAANFKNNSYYLEFDSDGNILACDDTRSDAVVVTWARTKGLL